MSPSTISSTRVMSDIQQADLLGSWIVEPPRLAILALQSGSHVLAECFAAEYDERFYLDFVDRRGETSLCLNHTTLSSEVTLKVEMTLWGLAE